MSKKIVVLVLCFLILVLSCNTTEPPPPERTITLTLDDVSLTEVWLKLTISNLQLPATLSLKQNDQTRKTISLVSSDTLLYIDSLLLNTTYSFQAFSIQPQVSSNKLQVTTMDTTSHNFTWQTWTFGEHSSSVLYDVAIIDENNIWVVGEIFMNDSLGQPDPTFYNVAHWNGQEWELMKILYAGGIWVIRTIFAFNENDVWFSAFIIYNGQNFVELPIPNVLIGWRINKFWGSSSNDLYIVGNKGNIVHYNGTSWQKIESGTEVDIHDIWGSVDNGTGEQTILAIASFQNYGIGMDLIKIDGLSASKLDTSGLRIAQSSVWFKGNKNIYVVGDGVFYKKYLNDPRWQQDETHPLLFKRRIRGNDWNDIFIVGDFGVVSHYNGKTWHHYRGNELPNLNGSYYSVSFSGNIVTAVGDLDNGQAIILRGNR
jgi:hypothetical protein